RHRSTLLTSRCGAGFVTSRFAMDAWAPDPRLAGVCHGAHFWEGPVLAILAMLARNSALCVAAGGSAPPNPLRCAPWLASGRSGRESRITRSNRKAGLCLAVWGGEPQGDRTRSFRRPGTLLGGVFRGLSSNLCAQRSPCGGKFACSVPSAIPLRGTVQSIDKLTWRREHSGE